MWSLAQEIKAKGFYPTIVSLISQVSPSSNSSSVSFHDRIAVYRVWLHQVSDGLRDKLAQFSSELSVIFADSKFDVIHAHDLESVVVGQRLRHDMACPLIATVHYLYSIPEISSVPYYRSLEKQSLSQCDAIIAVSHSVAERLRDMQISKCSRVIHNAVDHELFYHDDAHTARTYPQKRVKFILYVGRLHREKGMQTLLPVLLRLLVEIPETRVLIVGRGSLQRDLMSLVSASIVRSRITFLDHVTSIATLRKLYSHAWITLVPSLYEPFGLAALEAMACGSPIIGTKNGGISDFVRNRIDGILVSPENPEDLSRAIAEVVMDEGFRHRLANSSLERSARYTWVKVADQTAEVYRITIGAFHEAMKGLYPHNSPRR